MRDIKTNRGKGIPKFLNKGPKKDACIMLEIIEGRIAASSFDPQIRLKYSSYRTGIFIRGMFYMCGFKERRVLDYKVPLIVTFQR